MPESSQMLREKTSELESAVSQVQQELARADATRRSEAHHRLAELVKKAREWLETTQEGGGEEAETAATRKAEEFLHEIQMHRTEL
jgi:ElaB/YqjD/DUF883 family membrane-anchored ribosome-binding protein